MGYVKAPVDSGWKIHMLQFVLYNWTTWLHV